MSDDNIIGIDGRQAVELRKDQAEREKREEILRQKLKREGLVLERGNAPGTYTIAHPQPPQPPYLNGWCDLSLEQVEDATLVSIREGLSSPETSLSSTHR